MKLNENLYAFTGGGTGGHIYPGLAVADELKILAKKNNQNIQIEWIGNSVGMDSKIIQKALGPDALATVDKFYGIPSGKLRRYMSLKNLTDLFKIAAGFFKAFHILRKTKPAILFSKGGFVSVPPCLAAHILKIPVYTHECDFTLGLANRINFKSADKMFVSYEETKNRLSAQDQQRVIVTGNPIRPTIYNGNKEKGLNFLGLEKPQKPILLVLGGSSGARQINELIFENIDYLCKNYIVVHQTGLLNADDNKSQDLQSTYKNDYKPYNFIYEEMADVLASADVILGRAGAGTIWESAVLFKPMVLVPLFGSGTRGDQVDNAMFFKEKNAAEVLIGKDADSKHLIDALNKMLDDNIRKQFSNAVKNVVGDKIPAKVIAELIYKK